MNQFTKQPCLTGKSEDASDTLGITQPSGLDRLSGYPDNLSW